MLVASLCLFVISSLPICEATIMPYPPSVAEMADSANIVVKAKVISAQPVKVKTDLDNDWWIVNEAKLTIISTLKDDGRNNLPKEIAFIYRSDIAPKDTPKMVINVGAENYANFKLQPGRTYIIFAKRTSGTTFRQLSQSYTMRSWEGFFRAANDTATAKGSKIQDVVWSELATLLGSDQADSANYARRTLLELSSGHESSTDGSDDFSRNRVLKAIFSSTGSQNIEGETLDNLLELLGSASPYISESSIVRYVWSKTKTPIGNWSPFHAVPSGLDVNAVTFLIKIADGKASAVQRQLAIASLGNCKNIEASKLIQNKLSSWLSSPIPEIRANAILLACDYPATISHDQKIKLLSDKSPEVRQKAANSIAITQDNSCIQFLEKMLKDQSANVKGSVALSLLTFPEDKVKNILAAHITDPDIGTTFVARLASFNLGANKELLLATCKKEKPSATIATSKCIYFQNALGTLPIGICNGLLIKYLDGLSGVELRNADKSPYVDCIIDNAIELTYQANDVYSLLLTHGLDEKAKAFKTKFIATKGKAYSGQFNGTDANFKVGYPAKK